MDIEIDFDMSLKDPLMLAFFATIGLNANLASLRAGGKVLGTFLIVVVGLLLLQNALGIGMATLLGLDPLMGLLAGSITLSGGTAPGRRGVSCSLSATVLPTPPRWRWPARLSAWCWAPDRRPGGALSGEALFLTGRDTGRSGGANAFEKPDVGRVITSLVLIESIALIAICLTLGKVVAQLLAGSVFELRPSSACCLSA